jgi:hypothetical protein
MNTKFLKLLLTTASVLALATVVSFAEEPAKKDGEKKCPNCPDAPAPKALIVSEDAPAKKDGEKKCPNCPDAPAPKA